MKTNPGGYISPENVIGRDKIINLIWQQLDQQCVLINAERRIGKTCVIKKMVAEPPSKWFPIYMDLERIHSAEEFARDIYDAIQGFLSGWKFSANIAKQIYEEHDFGGWKKNVKKPWKKLLTTAIQELVNEQKKAEKSLIMFWDEVPYMIDNIRKANGEQVAAEVLDTLRSLRQTYPELRMVFTGSIGIHHVIASLNEAHIATAPINDMLAIEVTPIELVHAKSLACNLIAGENLASSDIEEAAEVIAHEAGCFPFYIHNIVHGLKINGKSADSSNIQQLVAEHLVDPNDPWELAHFRKRIPIYYVIAEDSKLVMLILDELAVSENHITTNEILDNINMQDNKMSDKDTLLRVLRLMEQDHYLYRNTEGEYQFRFPLIRRWWKLDRGI